MRKLFISAGHAPVTYNSNGKRVPLDNGAYGNGVVEGDLALEFRNLLVKDLQLLGITPQIDKDTNVLSETLKIFRNLTTQNDIVIDIHFNSAGNPAATGCEVLIPGNFTPKEQEIAKEISKIISETLLIKDRGVKTELQSARGKLGWMTLSGINILLEICFISNKEDVKSYQKNKSILSKKIANYLKTLI